MAKFLDSERLFVGYKPKSMNAGFSPEKTIILEPSSSSIIPL
jgi:hypothetical protein